MIIRRYRELDREVIKKIASICFDGVSIDQNIEKLFGRIGGKDWVWRKKQQIEEDINTHPDGIFIAELNNSVVGYITTRVDRMTIIGNIPNFCVLPPHQKKGVGRKLVDAAIVHLKSEGMEYVRIETLEQNAVGQHFYFKFGFKEMAQQIQYIMPINGTS